MSSNGETKTIDDGAVETFKKFLAENCGKDMSRMLYSLISCYDNNAYRYTSKDEFDKTLFFADDLYNFLIAIE